MDYHFQLVNLSEEYSFMSIKDRQTHKTEVITFKAILGDEILVAQHVVPHDKQSSITS